MDAIRINDETVIEAGELSFSASRSRGPGGQNVNKVASRVTVRFDVAASGSLSDEQRGRVLRRLATRIDQRGVLRVSASSERSQSANRRAAVDRIVELLRWALARPKPRKKTRPTRASRQRRLQEKARRGAIKRLRGRREPAGED